MKRVSKYFTVLFSMNFLFLGTLFSQLDEVHFRNGNVWQGKVLSIGKKDYSFQKIENTQKTGKAEKIPKNAVKYILYADKEKAQKLFKFESLRKTYKHKVGKTKQDEGIFNDDAEFLPTGTFDEKLLAELKKVKKSVYIFTYLVFLSNDEIFKSLLGELKTKAKNGLDIKIIVSQDAGTRQPVRVMTLDACKKILKEESRIEIRYSTGGQVMHKKSWLIDDDVAFMGSSNFSISSFTYGNNANIYIKSKELAKSARQDFLNLWSKCHKID